MTNDEGQMTNEVRRPKSEFVIRDLSYFCYLAFVIRHFSD
jgi:hypothetical protein